MQVKLSLTSSCRENSKLSASDVHRAAKELKQRESSDEHLQATSMATSFLKSVTTSCKVLGHTAEAAKEARRKLYALSDYFGPHSLFFTVTPDDKCSFRFRMYVNKGREIKFLVLNALKLTVYKILSLDTRSQYHDIGAPQPNMITFIGLESSSSKSYSTFITKNSLQHNN